MTHHSEPAREAVAQSPLDIAMDALFDVRRAIFNADPNVLTDTLWMPADTWMGGTVVDFIEDAMERVRALSAAPAPASGVEAVATVEKLFGNCDAWGAAEWFDRLANAIIEQDKAVVVGDMLAMETYQNIAASSAMQLVRGYRTQVTAALAAPAALASHEPAICETQAALCSTGATQAPAATTEAGQWEGSLAQRNLMDGWAAMGMIREAIETLGPIGVLPASEHLAGPTLLHEAEAIVAGIMSMRAHPAPSTGASAVKVKALEWRMANPDGESETAYADSILGEYTAFSFRSLSKHKRMIYGWQRRSGEEIHVGSFAAAKAAAQSDYETRIRAALETTANAAFKVGDRVRKTKGSRWQGRVVGTYRTELTPEGYCVESETEVGSVQIYPAAALEGRSDG